MPTRNGVSSAAFTVWPQPASSTANRRQSPVSHHDHHRDPSAFRRSSQSLAAQVRTTPAAGAALLSPPCERGRERTLAAGALLGRDARPPPIGIAKTDVEPGLLIQQSDVLVSPSRDNRTRSALPGQGFRGAYRVAPTRDQRRQRERQASRCTTTITAISLHFASPPQPAAARNWFGAAFTARGRVILPMRRMRLRTHARRWSPSRPRQSPAAHRYR